jgi:holo-[acyl-carrier protein] synthase
MTAGRMVTWAAKLPGASVCWGNGGTSVILGTGVDLAEVARIRASIERYGERFTRRVFTEREIAYSERKANKYERYAARFAAKEAGMKAIGTGWSGGITWKDLEVTNLPSGRPTLALHGVARDVADRLGVQTIHLSLTHTSGQALAWVVLEG